MKHVITGESLTEKQLIKRIYKLYPDGKVDGLQLTHCTVTRISRPIWTSRKRSKKLFSKKLGRFEIVIRKHREEGVLLGEFIDPVNMFIVGNRFFGV